MSEPLNATGDPWVDAYLTFRQSTARVLLRPVA
jgi:hypothetical protein